MFEQHLIDDPSDLWQRIGAGLLAQSPILLLCLAGVIVALVLMHRRAAPAALVAAALLLLFVWSVLSTVLAQHALQAVMVGERHPSEQQSVFLTLDIVWLVVRAAVLGMLVVAALGWRSTKGRAVRVVQATASGSPGTGVGEGPSKPISKGLFITLMFGSSLVAWLMLVPAYAILIAENEDLILVSLGFSCSAYILGLLATVAGCVLLYKLWATIQDGPATVTPGKAVGFLFIPLFNLYWIFRAVFGWSVEFNRYAESRGIGAARVPEGLFLTACILAVIPVVSILASPLLFVMLWICYSRAIDGANTIRALRRGETGNPAVPA